METPNFDIQNAHKYFSADCFNKTWEIMDKDNPRSIEDDFEMLHTAIASLWHWTQRDDKTDKNLAVGYWQVSRVYCLVGQPRNARKYGTLSLQYAKDLSPFYKGYAYETLARAEMVAENPVIMRVYLDKARESLEQVEDAEQKQQLEKDLETIS